MCALPACRAVILHAKLVKAKSSCVYLTDAIAALRYDMCHEILTQRTFFAIMCNTLLSLLLAGTNFS